MIQNWYPLKRHLSGIERCIAIENQWLIKAKYNCASVEGDKIKHKLTKHAARKPKFEN